MTIQTVENEVTNPNLSVQYEDAMDEILALIKARVPIIWVLTHEENRFISDFKKRIADPYKRQLWVWSGYQGLVRVQGQMGIQVAQGEEKDTHVITKCLDRIANMKKAQGEEKGICYIMRDMQIALPENISRQIRDMFEHLMGHAKTLIIVSPILAHGAGGTQSGLPPTLDKCISVVKYELPDEHVIKTRVKDILKQMYHGVKTQDKKIKLDYTEEEYTQIARALRGLTQLEVDNAVSTCMTKCKELYVERLINEKKQIVSRDDILEFVTDIVHEDDVGGLDNLKSYLNKYKDAHTDEAKAYGVEPLKGIILTGVPGTGKSHTAKMMRTIWKLPLLRLDIGKVMGSLVGQSEAKMRQAIQQVTAMAPCILWIDEIEKGLSGTKSSNFSDGGTLSRVFGTLLHAMQDKMSGVTIIATANDISKLPPELIRRFNEVFFVDLPSDEERWEIFNIHITKRGRSIDAFKKYKTKILEASVDYTGAEIEKAVQDSIAEAFCSGHKDVSYREVLKALSETKPIVKVMQKQIKKIREDARGQYKYASSQAENQSKTREVTTKSGKKLDMNEALNDLPELVKSKKEKNNSELASRDSRFSASVEEA